VKPTDKTLFHIQPETDIALQMAEDCFRLWTNGDYYQVGNTFCAYLTLIETALTADMLEDHGFQFEIELS
jgi:hypothetical protein